MKWIALIIICWLLFLLALNLYHDNKDSCQGLGGEYVFTDGHYKCLKELP